MFHLLREGKLMRHVFLGITLTSALLAAQESSKPADLILHHGVVLTVDANDTVAEALAIRDGRVIAVGTDARVQGFTGPKTRVIDLAGRTVTPGLIDTHAHLLSTGVDELVDIDLTRLPRSTS